MAYTLDRLHRNRMLTSLNLIVDFSKFDKNFFQVANRLIYLFDKKHKDVIRSAMHRWYTAVLNPTRVKKISNNFNTFITAETKEIQKSNKEWSTLRKEYKKAELTKEAKSHFGNVFNALLKKDTKRMFDLWRDK